MAKIRVLIVDDAATVRWFLTSAVKRDPALEVAAAVKDGQEALDRLEELAPDVVLLDLEMPRLDGLETLAALRARNRRLPIIIFSQHAHRGAEKTVKALALGATDYVPKPGEGRDVEQCIDGILIPKIKQLARPGAGLARPTQMKPAGETRAGLTGRPTSKLGLPAPTPSRISVSVPPATPSQVGLPAPMRTSGSRPTLPGRASVVGIGASTGGPNALVDLFMGFPSDWSVPTFIVQHMPVDFTGPFAQRLAAKSGLKVAEATGGERVGPGQVWLAPGGQHMEVRRDGEAVRVVLHQGPPEHSCRPAVDVLFRSLAEVYGAGVLTVVLTGMGKDGMRGCERVREGGGQVVVQDEATSVIWSMPGAVVRAGLADSVLPLDELAAEITRRTRRSG